MARRIKALKTRGHREHRSKRGRTNKYNDGRDRISRKIALLKRRNKL